MIYIVLGSVLIVLAAAWYFIRRAYSDIDDIVKSVDSLIKRERENAND